MTDLQEMQLKIDALNDEVNARERDLDDALAEVNRLRVALEDMRESIRQALDG